MSQETTETTAGKDPQTGTDLRAIAAKWEAKLNPESAPAEPAATPAETQTPPAPVTETPAKPVSAKEALRAAELEAELQREMSAAKKAREEAQAELDRLKKLGPLEYLKERGLDPIDTANRLYRGELGDATPKELSEKIAETDVDARVKAAIEEALAKRDQEHAERQKQANWMQSVNALDDGIKTVIEAVPAECPELQRLAKKDKAAAYDEMCAVVKETLQETGVLPTALQVAQALEEGLKRYRALTTDDAPKAKTSDEDSPDDEDDKRHSTSLPDSDTAEVPSRPSAKTREDRLRAGLRKLEEINRRAR